MHPCSLELPSADSGSVRRSDALHKAGPGDVTFRAAELRTGVVPQTWTIPMTSDTGDDRLEGSLTSPVVYGTDDVSIEAFHIFQPPMRE